MTARASVTMCGIDEFHAHTYSITTNHIQGTTGDFALKDYTIQKQDEPNVVVTLTALDDSLNACLSCLKVCTMAWPYKSSNDVAKSFTEEDGTRDKFAIASQHLAGELEPNWGDESVRELHTNSNDEFVDFEGWDKAGFVEKYGVDPEKIGLPPCERTHPLSNEKCTVYFAPKPGPLFTLRLSARDSAQWVQEQMTKQVYDRQGEDTAIFISQNFDIQKNYGSILLDRAKFTSLLAQVSLQQQRPGAGPGSVTGKWAASASTSSFTNATNVMALSSPAKAKIGSSLNQLADMSPPSSSVKVLRPPVVTSGGSKPGPPRVIVHAPSAETLASSIGEKRSAEFRGTSPAVKAARTGTGSVASRSTRGPTGHLTLNCNSTAVPLSMPGVVPKASRSVADNESVWSMSRGDMSKDKYERAMQKTPLFMAFGGVQSANAVANLKKMITTGRNEMEIQSSAKCQDHYDRFQACVGMYWPNMLHAAWEATRKNAVAIKEMKDPKVDVPPMNWMYYAGRRAIEFVEPRAKTTDTEAFGKCLNFQLAYAPEKQNFDLPSLCSENVSESIYKENAATVVSTVIIEGVYIHSLNRGFQSKSALVNQLRMTTVWVQSLPEKLRGQLQDLVVKTKCLSCIFGILPFENNSSVKDVSKVMDDKSDIITITLTDKDFWGKPIIEGIWSRTASESAAWLQMKPCLQDLQNKTADPDNKHITLALAKYSAWKLAIRPSAMKVFEDAMSTFLVHIMDQHDFSTIDSKGVKELAIQWCRKR